MRLKKHGFSLAMNKWTLLLILIALAAVGMLNRDKISAYLGQKTEQTGDAAATPAAAPPTATPNPAVESRATAARMYPAIAVPNSSFNVRFLQLFNATKTSDPASLAEADWPVKLAQQVAHDLNVAAITPTPPPTELSKSQLNARPISYAASTVPPSVQLPGLKGSSLDQRPATHH
jgi:hypothetical protein